MKQLLKSAAKISLVYSNAYRLEKNKIKKGEREKMENSDYWILGSNRVEKKIVHVIKQCKCFQFWKSLFGGFK